jgi:hypothetical protein
LEGIKVFHRPKPASIEVTGVKLGSVKHRLVHKLLHHEARTDFLDHGLEIKASHVLLEHVKPFLRKFLKSFFIAEKYLSISQSYDSTSPPVALEDLFLAKELAMLHLLNPVLDSPGDLSHFPLHLVHWVPVKTVYLNDCFDYQFAFFAEIEGLRRASDIVHFIALLKFQHL